MKKSKWIVSGFVIIVFLFMPKAQAHSAEEIEAWERDWQLRLIKVADQVALEDLTFETAEAFQKLYEERLDWEQRHLCHYETCTTASTSGSNPAPKSSSWSGSVEEWRPLVASYFAASEVNTALCLMSYESGGNPNAQNPSSGASGLMQVLPSWAGNFGYSPADLFNPAVNLEISKALYNDGGWSHWSPYNRGLCRGL